VSLFVHLWGHPSKILPKIVWHPQAPLGTREVLPSGIAILGLVGQDLGMFDLQKKHREHCGQELQKVVPTLAGITGNLYQPHLGVARYNYDVPPQVPTKVGTIRATFLLKIPSGSPWHASL
jgi:hypothetical protein